MSHADAIKPDSTHVAAAPKGGGLAARVSDHVAMTKPRITLMVVLTAWVGFALGQQEAAIAWPMLIGTLAGTALACMGAAVLNAAMEHRTDRLMQRTRTRPLPAGRISRVEATVSGVLLSALGTAMLLWLGGPLPATLATATVLLYVLLYTPLKRVTWWNTVVGTIPGATPPLIGYAAATGTLALPAWLVFAIVALWQLPHFWAIAYLYKEDYAAAGLRMLPIDAIDPAATRTRWAILLTAVATAIAGVLPSLLDVSGPWALLVSIMMGAGLVAVAVPMFLHPSRPAARRVFLASLIYLPPILAAIVLDPA